MAKAATRTATKPLPKSTAQRASAPAGNKASQAAAHQGRPAPKDPPRAGAKDTQPHTDKLDQMKAPAIRRPGPPPVSAESMDQLPDFMRGDVHAGKENIGNEDIEIPRIKLIQGLSSELQEYNDLRPGNFFHTAAEMIFDEPFRIVPLYLDKRYILWRPRDAGGGILARADDGVHWSPSEGSFTVVLDKKDGGDTVTWKLAKTVQQSGLAMWGTMNPGDTNSPPAATQMYNVVCAFPDHPDLMPAALTFQRSSIKIGRRFNSKVKVIPAPLYGMVFELSSFEDTNGRGQSFSNILVKGGGLVQDKEMFENYKQMYESLRQTGLTLKDLDSLQGEDGQEDGADAGQEEGAARF